jgi:hypothetical protein
VILTLLILLLCSKINLAEQQENIKMYGYRCEYCEGTVREREIEKEGFKHKKGFVMLESVPVGHFTIDVEIFAGILISP